MIRLIDVITETEEDVEFGTCELCFSTGSLTTETFVFQDDITKETLCIENGYWSWGSYTTLYEIDNLVKFADFINQQNIQSLDTIRNNLDYIVEQYYEGVEE